MTTQAQRKAMGSPTEVVTDPDLKGLLRRLAGVQLAEGTNLDDNTWVWVTAFADFDYEYAYLIDVRKGTRARGQPVTTSDYLAFFEGYDGHGQNVVQASWWGHAETFPDVPNLYDALAWWAQWVKETRQGAHDESAT